MEIAQVDLIQQIHNEFENSGGYLSLTLNEFADYFQLEKPQVEKSIKKLISTGHYQIVKAFDFQLGKECERFQLHPSYEQNFWLRPLLIPSEAKALLKLGSILNYPFNSLIKNLEINDRHLVRLTLIDHNIGSFPPLIGAFRYLEVLKVQRCQLTSLPDSLGSLWKLKILDLDYNHLSSLPKSLGNLENLQEFWCRHNMLTTLPDSLGNLENLEELSLEHNCLTSLPASLGSLVHLRRLFLNGNPTLTSLPTCLQNLPNLTILGLSDSRLLHSQVQLELNAQKRKQKKIHRYLHRSDVPQSQVPSLSRADLKDQYVLKLCITGRNTDLNCRIVRNIAEGAFSSNYMPTIGVDITSKVVTVNDQEVKLIFHSTAGQEYFGKLRRFYYEGSVGCIIIFDKGDRASFDTVHYWCQDYRGVQGVEKPIAILGVITDSEEVTTEQGQQLAIDLNCTYFECPSTNGPHVQEVFESLTRQAIGLPDLDHKEDPIEESRVFHPIIQSEDYIDVRLSHYQLYVEHIWTNQDPYSQDETVELWIKHFLPFDRRLGGNKRGDHSK